MAAERFREAIARDAMERPGYFPHYWLGVAYDELHETSKAFAEWRESRTAGSDRGDEPRKLAMKRRMSAHMQTASLPPVRPTLPLPPPPLIRSQTMITTRTSIDRHDWLSPPTATMTQTVAMTTATTGTATTTEHQLDPTTPEGQLCNEIDQSFKALNPGELLITAPQEMRVAVSERFILRIAAANQNDGIDLDLPTGGQTSTSRLHVTPTMRATLDGVGFTIQSNPKRSRSSAAARSPSGHGRSRRPRAAIASSSLPFTCSSKVS